LRPIRQAARSAQNSGKIVKFDKTSTRFRQAREAFRSLRRPSIVIIVATVKVSEKILENFSDFLKFNFKITASPFLPSK
jgi:ribosomal protein S2